jgi:dipeptidyl aminopeptidase/acylaminoacyl peptidase
VTAPNVAAFAPVWSADGRSLYFVAGPAGQWDPVAAVAGRGVGDRRIHVYDRITGAIRSLAHEPGHEEEGVRPSRDGTRLLVLRRATAGAADIRSIPNVDLEVWLTDPSGGHGTVLVRFVGAGLNAYGYPTGPSEWDWSE